MEEFHESIGGASCYFGQHCLLGLDLGYFSNYTKSSFCSFLRDKLNSEQICLECPLIDKLFGEVSLPIELSHYLLLQSNSFLITIFSQNYIQMNP
jgi:hypothetical protein